MNNEKIKKEIYALLATIIPQNEDGDLIKLGYVSLVRELRENTWSIVLDIPYRKLKEHLSLKGIVENEVGQKLSIPHVHVAITSQSEADKVKVEAQKSDANTVGIKNIKHIIAVASGKGGVGKSTFTTNLALALAQIGLEVGVIDADIYGPSQARMMGVSGKPASPDGKIILPKENYGLKIMSMGLMVSQKTPMIWRGPMVQSALRNLLEQTLWGKLDILLADMPPGTGDIALSMSQQVPLSGAIVISTPQDVALIDAQKAIAMFERLKVPVLGLVENMSFFACPNCGAKSEIFGSGGVVMEAKASNISLLGQIPIDIRLRSGADEGRPLLAQQGLEDDALVVGFRSMAQRAIAELKF